MVAEEIEAPLDPPDERLLIATPRLLVQHGIHPHSGLDRRVLAVLLHKDVGGAVDVEVGEHSLLNVVHRLYSGNSCAKISPSKPLAAQ